MTEPRTTTTHSDCICGGSGMLFVDDDYIRRHAARSSEGSGTDMGALMEAYRWSVIPCHECRPTQYKLWAGGHFRPNHSCSECRPPRRRQQRRGADQ